jgi:DNA-directed RNA polymerase subunit RPC12/RpoP
MDRRFKAPNKSVYDFYNKIYIECPRCRSRAVITKKSMNKTELKDIEVLACEKCGYLKEGSLLYLQEHPELWLKVKCCGQILWALNENHLDYIEGFVKAMLREQVQSDLGCYNQSIASRLPKWIQDSKNREEILKGISKLRNMLK